MSRDEIIRLIYAENSGHLSNGDISILLMNYCLENDKPSTESTMFITALYKIPIQLSYCISHALRWYERKYSINKLYSRPNPLNIGDGRSLILIY